jgi:cytochrome bd-type quinol oxidase subunit 2
VTQQQLNLLAVVSVVVCWAAFAATWLAAENYNQGRAPAERTRSWFGSAVLPGAIVIAVVTIAVPKADWHSLSFFAPAVRLLGLVILLGATAFTIWARLVLGVM